MDLTLHPQYDMIGQIFEYGVAYLCFTPYLTTHCTPCIATRQNIQQYYPGYIQTCRRDK